MIIFIQVYLILDEIKRVKDEKVVDLRFENYLIEEEVEEDSVSEDSNLIKLSKEANFK